MLIQGHQFDHATFYPYQIRQMIDVAWHESARHLRPGNTREHGTGILNPYRFPGYPDNESIHVKFAPLSRMNEYMLLDFQMSP